MQQQKQAAFLIYRAWELAALIAATLLWLIFPQTSFGPYFVLAAIAYVCVRDWRGARTLRGRFDWSRIHRRAWLVIAVAAFIFCYPLLFLAYLYLAVRDAWVWRQGNHDRIRARIAELERELGRSTGQERQQ